MHRKKQREMMRRKVDEVQFQNTVKECRKFYKYAKNLLKIINLTYLPTLLHGAVSFLRS